MFENNLSRLVLKKRGKRQLGKINYAYVKICTSFKSTRTLTTIPTKWFEKGWSWLPTLSSPRHWMLQRANVPTTDKLYTITRLCYNPPVFLERGGCGEIGVKDSTSLHCKLVPMRISSIAQHSSSAFTTWLTAQATSVIAFRNKKGACRSP